MKLGLSTLHNTRWHCPNLTIFPHNVFKFVHVTKKQHPLPPLYTMHLGKISSSI